MPPKGSDLIFDHPHNAADRVLLDCRGAGILVRRAHRTGPVTPTVKLGAGHGAGVGRSAGRDALMPPRLEDGLRDGRAVGRVPRDRGRSGGRTPARAHPASGLRLAAGPRNVGAAARRVRTLPAVTLSDTGSQGERTRSRRYGREPDREHDCLIYTPNRHSRAARVCRLVRAVMMRGGCRVRRAGRPGRQSRLLGLAPVRPCRPARAPR